MKYIVVDTSALVRVFTNDNKLKAKKVKDILESNKKLVIPDVVFPELEYILRGKVYKQPREKIQLAFEYLLSRDNIKISPEVRSAISIFSRTNLDMVDCIVAATGKDKKI